MKRRILIKELFLHSLKCTFNLHCLSMRRGLAGERTTSAASELNHRFVFRESLRNSNNGCFISERVVRNSDSAENIMHMHGRLWYIRLYVYIYIYVYYV